MNEYTKKGFLILSDVETPMMENLNTYLKYR
jgi:hypothetical protein